MTYQVSVPAGTRRPGSLVGARRVVTVVFATQGFAVASMFTTIPAVIDHLKLAPLLTTAVMVAVALTAGAGSFTGMAAIRRVGPVATMRGAVLTCAAALVLIGWAPGQATAIGAYLLYGLGVGALDVGANTRATQVERAYGRSIFASFYAAWSAAGVVAALLTAGAARMHWSLAEVLTIEAAFVVVLAACIRTHLVAAPARGGHTQAAAREPLARKVWLRLIPFGLVLMVVYIVDSTISSWSAVYLHLTLDASLAVAPLAYAAYQVGTVVGRACADRLVQSLGATAVVRTATLLSAGAMAGVASAPNWPVAVLAAGLTGLGVSALVPLCLASAGRLRPQAAEAVLARMNLFNYVGVIAGGAVSGVLGSTGHFRLAYAAPAAVAVLLLAAAPYFTSPDGSALLDDEALERTGADARLNQMTASWD